MIEHNHRCRLRPTMYKFFANRNVPPTTVVHFLANFLPTHAQSALERLLWQIHRVCPQPKNSPHAFIGSHRCQLKWR